MGLHLTVWPLINLRNYLVTFKMISAKYYPYLKKTRVYRFVSIKTSEVKDERKKKIITSIFRLFRKFTKAKGSIAFRSPIGASPDGDCCCGCVQIIIFH